MYISPDTNVLPQAQQILWPLLREIPSKYVLYGGTAIALRYGHRESVDFDFFTTKAFKLDEVKKLNFIQKYVETSKAHGNSFHDFFLNINGLTPLVKVSFANSAEFIIPARVNEPDICKGNNLKIASPLDLMVGKLYALEDRSTPKDFIDLAVLIENGASLQKGFEAAFCVAKHFSGNVLPQDILLKNLKDMLSSIDHVSNMLKDYPKMHDRAQLIVSCARKIDLEKLGHVKVKTYKDLSEGISLQR